jgi:hypothetical protein
VKRLTKQILKSENVKGGGKSLSVIHPFLKIQADEHVVHICHLEVLNYQHENNDSNEH